VSYREWVANNGRGRLRIYSDDMLCRFDTLKGSMAFRQGNVMIEYEDHQTNQKTTIIAENCVVWEEDNQVYLQLTGRRVIHTEPLSTRRTVPIPRKNQRPIEVYNEF
jgi:hypothetical protein